MSSKEIITAIIPILGGSTISILVLGFLTKRWIGIRIDESVRLECAKQLEDYKSTLQDQSIDRIEERDADRNLYKQFQILLPIDSHCLYFIKNAPMSESFRWDEIDAIDTFSRNWDHVEYRFHNSQVEEQKMEFHKHMSAFRAFLGANSFYDDDQIHSSIHRDWKRSKPTDYYEMISKADELASASYSAYERFVQSAKTNLKI